MSGIRNTLEIARSALVSSQVALDVTGNNIANANTEGYSRRRAIMESESQRTAQNFVIGKGVIVSRIERVRDQYIETQLRTQQQSLSYWETLQTKYARLEDIFTEPSEAGLGEMMNKFFDSWQGLATDPQSYTARSNVLQKANSLASKFRTTAKHISDLKDEIRSEFNNQLEKFNSLAEQLAEINIQLPLSTEQAADLLDRRDNLLMQMNKIANVQTMENEYGQVTISLGGKVLLENSKVVKLVEASADEPLNTLHWEDNSRASKASNGQLAALARFHDETLQDYSDQLDELATSLVEGVNELHKTGYGLEGSTNVNFFDPSTTGAADIQVSSEVADNAEKIAVSADGNRGNGEIARQIAQLVNDSSMVNNSFSFHDYYGTTIARLGNEVQDTTVKLDGQKMLVNQIRTHQESASGVSLDEEMTNLIQFQRAYQAAAKLINVVDEMMDTILRMV